MRKLGNGREGEGERRSDIGSHFHFHSYIIIVLNHILEDSKSTFFSWFYL